MKYGIWKVGHPRPDGVNALMGGGYAPLTAMILSARGMDSPRTANQYLDNNAPLVDPYRLTDMDKAVARIRRALEQGEKMAVFGDYDVDGITSTCLLTDFLRRRGGQCLHYIPGRLEEGYGLNPIAVDYLHSQGVQLIITVDCGITALEEAQLCARLGMDLVITDHHECKPQLPQAVAVVDPHRLDGGYPHKNLSGVGVAFKLAAAIDGDQEAVLRQYADMVCLGTVADVMLLQGENRVFVTRGLESLRHTRRVGLAALMEESGCAQESLTASTIGYILAPRINAAGRMGQIDLATELFLTRDPQRARELAHALCELNRLRQTVESEIYQQAVAMLPRDSAPEAIVLADDSWHQGVVGIVASRMAEEFCCPAFLICLDGPHGKASSRSFGGFNLFASLTALSPLLESFGGHELAAGFTIARDKIDDFRQEISRLANAYYDGAPQQAVLEADCVISPELLTLKSIASLEILEPCGSGCPKPVLVMENLVVERLQSVGGGRHLRLRMRQGSYSFNAIFFSATAQSASVAQGDLVDVAFSPQINEFRGERSVQMNLLDIRPACKMPCCEDLVPYRHLRSRTLNARYAAQLHPDRATLGFVWRYLAACPDGAIEEDPLCLCRKIVRWAGRELSLSKLLTCLDIFRDVGLVEYTRTHKTITLRLCKLNAKADLDQSQTLQYILQRKES